MKNYKTFLLLLLTPFFLSTIHNKKRKNNAEVAGKWSGTVSFLEKRTGAEAFISEWRMDATIINDTGTVIHSSKYSDSQGSGRCTNQGKTQLEVGIDEEKNTYSIMVYVPGCYGTQTRGGVTTPYPVTDETAITVDNQTIGSNRNSLSGRTHKIEQVGDLQITTIYDWTLTKR